MKPTKGSHMTKITSVDARTLTIPLDIKTSFSTRQVTERCYTIVRVHGDDGTSGIGFCYAGSHAGGIVTAAVRDILAPVINGQDAHRVEGLWSEMYQASLLHGRTGSVLRALSAVDIALWDRNARAAELPLFKLLGATSEGRVPAYASGGYYTPGKTPKDLGAELQAYVEDGFRAVKIKVGGASIAADVERLAAAREAIGTETLLMLDANNAWRDLPDALRAMRRFEAYDPYWIEEPFSPDDIDNHARLAQKTPVLVATGELEVGRWRHKELLVRDAVHILQTDAAVCGGVTEFRRIAATASSFGVTLSPHWFHDLHAHLVAATPNARFVEFFPDDQVLNFRRLVDRQLEVHDGDLLLSERPGLGFDFDEEAIERYAVDAWA